MPAAYEMMTYVYLNTVFLVALVALIALRRRSISLRAVLGSLIVVLALTAVFDPTIIAAGLVAYDDTKFLGLYWLGAPIEDFAYAVFAVPFVAIVWHMFGDTK